MNDKPGLYDSTTDALRILGPLCAVGLVVWALAVWKVIDLVHEVVGGLHGI